MKTINNAANAPAPVGPYSQAVVANGLVFCAGQVGIAPETGEMVSDSIEEQTRQTLSNMDAVLRAAGSSRDAVTLVTIFLSDINFGPAVNEIYTDFFAGTDLPARQTVAVKALPLGALIEISVIAAVG